MPAVSIEPPFGDEHMEGEYDDERFAEADTRLQGSVHSAIKAGAKSEDIEEWVQNALDDAGIA